MLPSNIFSPSADDRNSMPQSFSCQRILAFLDKLPRACPPDSCDDNLELQERFRMRRWMIADADAIMACHHKLSTQRLGEDDRMRLGVKWGHAKSPCCSVVAILR